MAKPTYYLWQKNAVEDEELKRQKELFTRAGFRVVVLKYRDDAAAVAAAAKRADDKGEIYNKEKGALS